MKLNCFKFILAFFTGLVLQESVAQKQMKGFSAYAIIGVNPSQIDGDRIWGFNLIKLHAGAGVSYFFNEKWKLNLEATYSGRGARSTQNQDYLKVKMDYVDIPIVSEFSFLLKEQMIHIIFGLTPSYLIQAQIDDFGVGFRNLTPYLKTWDLGTTGGVKFYVNNRISFISKYTYSLFPINKPSTNLLSPILVYGDWYNNYLTFIVQYTLW